MFKRDNKGFTIIEVLIVLAIAGLILLIVFLAVPALQRNSRNTARNNDAARISASITECLSNRNGITTSCDGGVTIDSTNVGNAANEIGYNPADYSEIASLATGTTAPTQPDVATYAFTNKCFEDGSRLWVTADGGTAPTLRQFAVLYLVETTNDPITRCVGSE